MSNTVIKAEHLSKYYRLGVINNGTLFRDLQTWWALKRGKQDPHSRIGENKYDPSKEGFWALKDIDFEIQQGDRVGIIGKNGAGKSTLLKILSRITAPTEGQIKIKGRVASLLEVGTGFHGELTGRENIYLNGAILGMKRREVSRKLDEIIAFSEIDQHIDTPVKRYSSGMYVRLAFAVAAHLDSEILIADEVLAVGDASFQKKALGKMNDLSTGQGRTVLFVSHNMGAVESLCNKGIVLERGKIICEGNISESAAFYFGKPKETRNSDLMIDFKDIFPHSDIIKLDSFSIKQNTPDYTKDLILYPDSNSDYFIEIQGEIFETNEKIVLFISLYDKNDNLIYTTDIFESGEVVPSDLHKGNFFIKLSFPVSELNVGDYYLSVSVVVHYFAWILEPQSNKLFFTINSSLEPHPVYEKDNHPMSGTHQKPGLLLRKLHTEIQYKNRQI